MTSTSTPAAASAVAFAATSPLMPSAAPTIRRPRIDRGLVERGAQRALAAEGADDLALVQHRSELEVGGDHEVERGARSVELVGVELGHGRSEQVAERRVRQRGREALGRDRAEERPVLVVHDQPDALHRRELGAARRRRSARAEVERGIPADRLVLDPADGGVQLLQRQVLRQHPESAAAGEGRGEPRPGHRVHVRRDDRDASPPCRRSGRGTTSSRLRDRGPARHQEHVGVGQIVRGRRVVQEAHSSTVLARTEAASASTEALKLDAVSSQVTGVAPEGESPGEFGANEWLVDEMYERWLVDKNSVDESWWPFLEQYQPVAQDADAPLMRAPTRTERTRSRADRSPAAPQIRPPAARRRSPTR